MTTTNTPDQRIDYILAELTSAIWLQAQMAVLDKHESYGDKAESQKLAKSQLKSLFETMIDGTLYVTLPKGVDKTCMKLLIEEQKKRSEKVISKYFNTEEK